MKKLTLLGAILVILLVLFVLNIDLKSDLVSPLVRQEKMALNQWFPSQVLGVFEDAPQISAKAAFFIDSKDGNVLYSKSAHLKIPVASLVKVMTAVVALENKSLDSKFTVSKKATEVEPDEMILLPGERLTLKELLYGIFLVSANDAAQVLAEDMGREEFISLMNNKAAQLGMKDTLFANPTGLDEEGANSYSSAYDLAILTRYAIRNFPVLVEISQTPYVKWEATEDRRDYEMYSGINLLTTYPGVVGFKTGYTPEAGYTIITLARKNGYEVIGVLLGSDYRRDEAKQLLDYSFGKLSL